MNIVIAGGSGMIGRRMAHLLREKGHIVLVLSRQVSQDPNLLYWDPALGKIDEAGLRQAEIVINLAGEGIADSKWTAERKAKIISSRTQSTQLIAKTLQAPGHNCKIYLSASAIGIYGDRGEEILTETDRPGTGFLTESCLLWEQSATDLAQLTQIPTAIVRVGIVLSTQGGALPKLAFPLLFMVAPHFGKGEMYYSWIHIDDLCRSFMHLMDKKLTGVFNAASPEPVSQRNLNRAMVAAKWTWALPVFVPQFLLKLGLGEMSHAVLDSARVSSQKLEDSGFSFNFPEPVLALKDIWERNV